jgi:hypothetical protein
VLQEPWQAAKPFASIRNCRAESVPAQRTAVTNAASNVFLIRSLFMAFSFPICRSSGRTFKSSYFARLTAGGLMHEPNLSLAGMEQKQSMLQGDCLLQMPPQKKLVAAWLRNCRAETVPAQRAAATIVARNTVLIVFIISRALPGMAFWLTASAWSGIICGAPTVTHNVLAPGCNSCCVSTISGRKEPGKQIRCY